MSKIYNNSNEHFLMACAFDDLKTIKRILRYREGVRFPLHINFKDEDKRSPLHWACLEPKNATCRANIVEFLLESGADINAKDCHGDKPYDLCKVGSEVAKVLNKYKALDMHKVPTQQGYEIRYEPKKIAA
jgi:ankyrin repeat protein